MAAKKRPEPEPREPVAPRTYSLKGMRRLATANPDDDLCRIGPSGSISIDVDELSKVGEYELRRDDVVVARCVVEPEDVASPAAQVRSPDMIRAQGGVDAVAATLDLARQTTLDERSRVKDRENRLCECEKANATLIEKNERLTTQLLELKHGSAKDEMLTQAIVSAHDLAVAWMARDFLVELKRRASIVIDQYEDEQEREFILRFCNSAAFREIVPVLPTPMRDATNSIGE